MHRATHEVNNALNAVAMNLEVARLRAVPGADAGRVAPFAAAAAESHEEVVAMVKPLMALARGTSGQSCDVREVAEQIVALLAPGVRAKGGALGLEPGAQPARTSAPTAAVCLGIAELLFVATIVPGLALRCTVELGPEPTFILDGAGVLIRPKSTQTLLKRAGVRPGPVAHALVFPSA